MKIVSTVIHRVIPGEEERIGELYFRVVLDSADWVLIKQFEQRSITVSIPIEITSYIDVKNSPLFRARVDPTSSEGDLVLDFDPKKLKKIEHKEGEITWETDTYVFKRKGRYGSVDELLNQFTNEIKAVFESRYRSVSDLPSYFEKEIEINYRGSKEV